MSGDRVLACNNGNVSPVTLACYIILGSVPSCSLVVQRRNEHKVFLGNEIGDVH